MQANAIAHANGNDIICFEYSLGKSEVSTKMRDFGPGSKRSDSQSQSDRGSQILLANGIMPSPPTGLAKSVLFIFFVSGVQSCSK